MRRGNGGTLELRGQRVAGGRRLFGRDPGNGLACGVPGGVPRRVPGGVPGRGFEGVFPGGIAGFARMVTFRARLRP